jgi:bifunctional ADP-heptose synthase (sugar kinase/adenylyltransferase)
MAVFSRKMGPVFLPVHGPSDAVDVTGAGDTVLAAYALAAAAGADPIEAAQVANVAGALKVQKSGTATVSAAELRGELELA